MIVALAALASCRHSPPPEPREADVLVIGAGIAGLSAALEAARAGRSVLVIDMLSVFGGHAIISTGGLSIVDTPLQRRRGIEDSPDLAFADFMAWGEDNNEAWVRYYVDHSREEIYDWLTELGAAFTAAVPPPGNSVPRYHFVRGQGLGLVMPIYRALLREPAVGFRFGTRADELIRRDGRIVGVRATELRSGKHLELHAGAVLIATGGLQSNLEAVRENWREDLSEPQRLLAGSGWNSRGSGLDLARDAGARIERLDHQWNYVTGIPDPRYPGESRGLSVLQVPPGREVWVNADGERFVGECTSPRDNLEAVLAQPGDSHWVVFDSRGKKNFIVSGSGWTRARTERLIFGSPGLVMRASSLAGLAERMQVDPQRLERSVAGYNARVGEDAAGGIPLCDSARRIDRPPYYAVRRYVLSRKSMGGIRIDAGARVVDVDGGVIPGLYAAGEASGFAGINGRAALEGTHLGPSIVTGRMAGRRMAAELAGQPVAGGSATLPVTRSTRPAAADGADTVCTGCHDLPALLGLDRPGYRHFGWSHRMVLDERMSCVTCHADLFPSAAGRHRRDLGRATRICVHCHGDPQSSSSP
ncbi:MAG: FAD-dependent oxidoreductase [Gammaproteobacteria bacterium]